MKWVVPAGLDKLDPEIPLKDTTAIVLIGDTGVYTVQCYGALNNQATDIASCVVTIGAPPTPPPGPNPPPGPTPPINPLTATFQTAYALDTDSDRAKSLDFVQTAYAAMVKQLQTTPAPAPWSMVATNADASVAIQAVIEAPGIGLTATQLKNLRTAIQVEMVKVFGGTATTPVTLSALTTELNNIATALSGVK